MRIEKIVNSPMDVNTYLMINEDNKCIVVDPSFEHEKIIHTINQLELEVEAVLLTHAHFDHIVSVTAICLSYDVPVYVHREELDFLYDGTKNLSSTFTTGNGIVIDNRVKVHPIDDSLSKIGSFSFSIFHTPGHSPGGISIYIKESHQLISGDCLFKGTVGRTDLPGSNPATLVESIKTNLINLPKETIVYPGHGPSTTIGDELLNNPFVRAMK